MCELHLDPEPVHCLSCGQLSLSELHVQPVRQEWVLLYLNNLHCLRPLMCNLLECHRLSALQVRLCEERLRKQYVLPLHPGPDVLQTRAGLHVCLRCELQLVRAQLDVLHQMLIRLRFSHQPDLFELWYWILHGLQ